MAKDLWKKCGVIIFRINRLDESKAETRTNHYNSNPVRKRRESNQALLLGLARMRQD